MRTYGRDQVSSRPKDAFDTVAIASLVPVPVSVELRAACEATIACRGDEVPTKPPSLPGSKWDVALRRTPLLIAQFPSRTIPGTYATCSQRSGIRSRALAYRRISASQPRRGHGSRRKARNPQCVFGR